MHTAPQSVQLSYAVGQVSFFLQNVIEEGITVSKRHVPDLAQRTKGSPLNYHSIPFHYKLV